VSDGLRLLGWEVYTTYYVPNMTLIALIVLAALLLTMGLATRSKSV
jgi:hypothetical protein